MTIHEIMCGTETRTTHAGDSPVCPGRQFLHAALLPGRNAEGWGYKVVVEAQNGHDLFRRLTVENAPDLCITDINMPVMNGYETIRRLKEHWPAIKVIAFSIYESVSELERALQSGADAIASKQNSFAYLKDILRETLNGIDNSTDININNTLI